MELTARVTVNINDEAINESTTNGATLEDVLREVVRNHFSTQPRYFHTTTAGDVTVDFIEWEPKEAT